MATQKYVNTDKDGMGEYSDAPGKRSKVIGGTQSKAGAGRGVVNPQRTDEADDTYVTPADRKKMEKIVSDRKSDAAAEAAYNKASGMKKGGAVKKMASGGSVSASRRGDGCATKGKTKGRMV
jgi:hypothetical protein